MSKLKLYNDFYSFVCPHCLNDITVYKNDLNCRIFRHGIYKDVITKSILIYQKYYVMN